MILSSSLPTIIRVKSHKRMARLDWPGEFRVNDFCLFVSFGSTIWFAAARAQADLSCSRNRWDFSVTRGRLCQHWTAMNHKTSNHNLTLHELYTFRSIYNYLVVCLLQLSIVPHRHGLFEHVIYFIIFLHGFLSLLILRCKGPSCSLTFVRHLASRDLMSNRMKTEKWSQSGGGVLESETLGLENAKINNKKKSNKRN